MTPVPDPAAAAPAPAPPPTPPPPPDTSSLAEALDSHTEVGLGGTSMIAGGSTDLPGTESPTVLDVDVWGMRRGKEALAYWEQTAKDEKREHGEAVFPMEALNGKVDQKEKERIAADAHTLLFEPAPTFADNPENKARAEWFKALLANKDIHEVRESTMFNTALSEIGALSVCNDWAKYVEEHEGEGGGEGPGDGGIGPVIDRHRSTSKTAKKMKEEVESAKDIAAGMGMGEPGSPIDPKLLSKYARMVGQDSQLRRIFDWAGKAIRLMEYIQSTKHDAIRGEISGTELSGDVGRLIGSELMQIAGAIPELQTMALVRLAQHRSLSYKHTRREQLAMGPIVMTVDESGSMQGDPVACAKGIALALCRLAKKQKRWIALVGFSGGEVGNVLAIPPKAWNDPQPLFDWLLHFYGNGTDCDVPIKEIPGRYWKDFIKQGLQRGKTDHIIITDGVMNARPDWLAKYKKWAKEEEVKTYGIILGGSSCQNLESVCDKHWVIRNLDLDQEAVKAVMAI